MRPILTIGPGAQRAERFRAGRDRPGIALFAALAVVTLVALLIGGAVATSTLMQRSSQLSYGDALLGAAADDALGAMLADADSLGLADLSLGGSAHWAMAFPGPPRVVATVSATRLPHDVLWLVARASMDGRDAGSRRANLVARWRTLGVAPSAPLMARGAVRLRGGLTFAADSGGDADCMQPGTGDINVPSSGLVTAADPVRVVVDPRAADSASYVAAAWQRRALDSVPGVVYVRGDTIIDGPGSQFDGILIVDGALTINGPFTATGLLVARGPIVATGSGLAVTGAMLSFAAPGGGAFALDLGAGAMRYAPCVVAHALRRAMPLHPVHQRSWSEFF